MCNPVAIGIGTAMFGGSMSLMKGRQEAAAAKTQAKVAKHNRDASYVAAAEVIQQTNYEVSRIKTRADHMVASLRGEAAGGSLRLDRGQPARLASDMTIMSEIDAKMVELRGAQKAAGFITQGDTFNAQAAVDAMEAKGAYMEAFGSAAYHFGQGYSAWLGRPQPAVQTPSNDFNWSMPDYANPPPNYVSYP